jgi:hypothetical protein
MDPSILNSQKEVHYGPSIRGKGKDQVEPRNEQRDGAVATIAAVAITTCGTLSHGPAT